MKTRFVQAFLVLGALVVASQADISGSNQNNGVGNADEEAKLGEQKPEYGSDKDKDMEYQRRCPWARGNNYESEPTMGDQKLSPQSKTKRKQQRRCPWARSNNYADRSGQTEKPIVNRIPFAPLLNPLLQPVLKILEKIAGDDLKNNKYVDLSDQSDIQLFNLNPANRLLSPLLQSLTKVREDVARNEASQYKQEDIYREWPTTHRHQHDHEEDFEPKGEKLMSQQPTHPTPDDWD